MRLIELSFADGDRVQPLLKATLKTEPVDHRLSEPDDRGRRLLRLVFKDGDGQKAIDAIQAIMEDEVDWRLVVLPIEATLPKIDESIDAATKTRRTLALREELYDDIAKGARLNSDFLLLTALSTLVVVFGLSADNIAAVIGAMVIAPLLGPILAFSFASALGDLPMMGKAARTALSGLAMGLGLSFAIGLIYEPNLASGELMSRTVVGLDAPALALAAGAAAALSIATGLPATLVGVMVAVALLPPAATAGMLAGAGEWTLAGRAALLLAINVVAVNLAALLVYFFKGVRPRTWLERRSAKRSVYVNGAVWLTLIIALSALAAHFAASDGAGFAP
ncbi:TIGR00341 family protein [Maricaulaceae bacterium EIL42A08]|nr:TIGR00341 family protein [Maricaulaceae bacterium EIL42A08]